MLDENTKKAVLLLSHFRKGFSVTQEHMDAFFEELSGFPELAPYMDIDLEKELSTLVSKGVFQKQNTPLKDVNALMINSSQRHLFKEARRENASGFVEQAFVNYYTRLSESIWLNKDFREAKTSAIIQDFLQLESANFEYAGLLSVGRNIKGFFYILNVWCNYLLNTLQFGQVISFGQRVLVQLEKTGTDWLRQHNQDAAHIYRVLADAYHRLGKKEQAATHFELAVNSSLIKTDQAGSIREWAAMESRHSQYQQALSLLSRAGEIYQEHNRILDLSIVRNEMAAVYERQGRLEEAIGIYVANLELYQNEPNTEFLSSQTLNDLARLFHNQQDYIRARAFYKRSLGIEEAYKGRLLEKVQCLSSLSVACMGLKEYDEAEYHLNNAIELHYHLDHPIVAGDLRHNQGNLAFARGRQDEALAFFKEAESIYDSPAQKANCQYDQGKIYLEQSDFQKAIEALLKAVDSYREANVEEVPYDTIYYHVSEAYEGMDDGPLAIEYQAKALDLARGVRDKVIHSTNLSLIKAKYGKTKEAWKVMWETATLLKQETPQEIVKIYLDSIHRLGDDLEEEPVRAMAEAGSRPLDEVNKLINQLSKT